MISRRAFLKTFLGGALLAFAGAGYAIGIEPFRCKITKYGLRPKQWPDGFRLKIAVLADIHACEPWMSAGRVRSIVEQTNKLAADIIVLLGDYTAAHRFTWGEVSANAWADQLGYLSAPLGVHAIMGNHDWWDDLAAQRAGHGPTIAEKALNQAGISTYHNKAVRLSKGDNAFWLAGLADQLALLGRYQTGRTGIVGLDDLDGTLGQISDRNPIILLAHEPDIFPKVPNQVALTLSGHTHGGQVRLFGQSPIVPSRYGNRYAYGKIEEDGKTLVVSGGLGCSIMPVRFGVPPEIVLIDLG